ncbi:hypothetical protein INS49_000174 [Diaporthe citri]|uniref:uncharacterized protein n=1 Tax=Diaporthe citri TaxID=83186 RepID=UPI001C7E7CA7|nr:uncharacterized protein INS49_000174 [Diaporthe citri]KAG6365998.1 hypothetical protein INS49_000174 [Diaporthe citri]
MSLDSPPPLDACPELTPDNGTPTSSCSGSVYWNRITHHVEEATGNSQVHNNALHIFDNVNHQASSSGTNNVAEHDDVPARERSTPGPQHLRCPHPAPTLPPRPRLRDRVPTEVISPVDIGSPMIPLSPDSRPATAVRFVGEPTAIHSSTPSPSRRPTSTIASPSGSSSRGGQGRWRLRDLLSDFKAWFRRGARGGGNGARPGRRRGLSPGWFARRRNAGA